MEIIIIMVKKKILKKVAKIFKKFVSTYLKGHKEVVELFLLNHVCDD